MTTATREEKIEAVARAMCSTWGYSWDGDREFDETVAPETCQFETPGKSLYREAAEAALTALESLSPGAPERHDTPLALHLAARVIADHENLEENAPVDPFCGGCNQGAGPHRAPCAYHAAVNIVARKADPRILDWILPAPLTAAPSAPAKEDGHG